MVEHVNEKQPPDVLTSDTENATKIEPKDALPHERQKFRKFRSYNTGMWNGPRRENKEMMYRQDNLHRYDSIASQLELTKYQKQRGRSILDTVKPSDFGKPIDQLLFAICIIVANADARGKRYWPHPNKGDNDKAFTKLGEELGLSISMQMSALMKLKSETGL
ncbi:hypothetical protein [Halomonas sp.]|uniref:hypothetical protein n=1 Tax=Halomonas sp. TaxID=1486246 RepID=UPI003564B036